MAPRSARPSARAIEDASADLKEALKGDDAEAIKAKTNTLAQASMKLGEAMYKAQQAAARRTPCPAARPARRTTWSTRSSPRSTTTRPTRSRRNAFLEITPISEKRVTPASSTSVNSVLHRLRAGASAACAWSSPTSSKPEPACCALALIASASSVFSRQVGKASSILRRVRRYWMPCSDRGGAGPSAWFLASFRGALMWPRGFGVLDHLHDRTRKDHPGDLLLLADAVDDVRVGIGGELICGIPRVPAGPSAR